MFLLTYFLIFSLDCGRSIPDNVFANVEAEIDKDAATFPPFLLGGLLDSTSFALLLFFLPLFFPIAIATSVESL